MTPCGKVVCLIAVGDEILAEGVFKGCGCEKGHTKA